MAAVRRFASQSRKLEPSSFKDTLSIKAQSHASLDSGAEDGGVEDVEVIILNLQT
jgi:hypothetical protein